MTAHWSKLFLHSSDLIPHIDVWGFVLSVVSARASASSRLPLVTNHLSSTDCHQPTATHQLPPTTSLQQIVTNKVPPTNCHQPIVNNQLLTTNFHQLIVANQLSSIVIHPPIVINQLSTNDLLANCLVQGVGCTPWRWLALAGAAGSPPLRRCDLRVVFYKVLRAWKIKNFDSGEMQKLLVLQGWCRQCAPRGRA